MLAAVTLGIGLIAGAAPQPRAADRLKDVQEAIEAGVRITCSTDSHSTLGLENLRLSVWTARRGRATPADVLNTRPLAELLARRRR